MNNELNLPIFKRQNIYFKIAVILFGIGISTIISLRNLCFIASATIIYLLFEPRVYITWLKALLKLVPLFISLYLLGIILKISFITQTVLSLRIIFILLLSVYLVTTSSLKDLLAGSTHKKDNKFSSDLLYFTIATINFIPIFLEQYKIQLTKSNNLMNIFSETISESVKQIKAVEVSTQTLIQTEHQSLCFWTFSNLYLMLLLTIYILIISI